MPTYSQTGLQASNAAPTTVQSGGYAGTGQWTGQQLQQYIANMLRNPNMRQMPNPVPGQANPVNPVSGAMPPSNQPFASGGQTQSTTMSAGGGGGAPAAPGLPSATAAQVGNVPSVTPPSLPNFASTVLAGLQPTFAQEDNALSNELADAGIVGGGAPGAMQQLQLQQGAQAQGAIQPGLIDIAGLNTQAQEANQGSALNASEFNAGAQNQAQQFDINNILQLLGMQNTDWLSQLGAASGFAGGGLNALTSAFNPMFYNPSSSGIQDLLGQYATGGGNFGGGGGTGGYGDYGGEANAATPGIPSVA